MARLPSLAARLEALPRAWIGAVLTAALAASALRPPPCAGPGSGAVAVRLRWCSEPRPAEPRRQRREPRPAAPPPQGRAPRPAAAGWRWRPNQGAPFPAELAVVAPLAIGDRLGPGRVFEIAHHADARLMVGVHVGAREAWLQVSRAEGGEVPARAVAGPYAVTLAGADGADGDADALAAALAAVIRRNAAVPVPREMGPLRRGGR